MNMTTPPSAPLPGGELTTPPFGHPSPEGNLFSRNSPPGRGAEGGVVSRNYTNYYKLPYNPALTERAKELRKSGNLAEVLFWNKIKRKSFMGLDFDRQKIIGNYIVDFYCPEYNVVIEIDGSSHANKSEYDLARDRYLQGLGLIVIHLYDSAVLGNLNGVMESLMTTPPFGHPSPEGND